MVNTCLDVDLLEDGVQLVQTEKGSKNGDDIHTDCKLQLQVLRLTY